MKKLQALRASGAMTLGALGLGASMSVLAQDTAATDDDVRLEEILVTAQKRSENLQEVPVSVQVVTGETLMEKNINTLENLTQGVPAVHVDTQPGRTSNMFIRGVGSGGNQSFDQSVGVFVDDIYHGRSRFTAASFLDLERVEVLKGPQSTFFGNNAIAGAFNIVSKKPGDSFDASVRALYGEYGQYALEGVVGGPLGDVFGARLAVIGNGHDGWLRDVNLGRRVSETDNLAGRLSFAFNPTESFDATLKIESSKNESDGLVYQIVNCPRPAPLSNNSGITANCTQALALGVPIGLDQNATSESGGQETDLDTNEFVLTANYEKWGHTFTSVSGYYEYDFNLNLDADILPVDVINVKAPEDYEQFSQELRITSPTGGVIEYLAGVYFQTGKLNFAQDYNFFFVGPFIGGVPPGQETNYAQDEDTYAVFGSATWNMTDRLKLTGGIRGSWVEKSFVYNLFYGAATQQYGGIVPYTGDLCTTTSASSGLQAFAGGLFGSPACTFNGSRSDHAWTPSARIQYEINADTMTYFRFDRGFKAGGFNGADNTGNPANLAFKPEHVTAYELGMKSEWFDNRLLLNLAVFHSEYKDLQVSLNTQDSVSGAFVSVVRNAAVSRSRGVELEAQWAVTQDFRLSANATYLDSRYVSYPNVSLTSLETYCQPRPTDPDCAARFPNGIGQFHDASGERTAFAPKWSGSVTGAYGIVMPGDFKLTLTLSGFYSSDWFKDILDEWTGAYFKLEGNLSLESPDARWAVDLIGKNLTDREIPIHGYGGGFSAKEQPRNVAVQFRYHW